LLNMLKSKGTESELYSGVGWGPEIASGAGRPLLPPGLGKSHRILRQVPKNIVKLCGKIEDCFQRYPYAFLPTTYLYSRKKREPYFLTSPRNLP
jgi:hypothetical protein